MAKANQTPQNSTDGKAPRDQLAREAARWIKPSTVNAVVRSHGYRTGTVALREIRKFQKTTELLICKLPLQHLVREIARTARGTYFFRWLIEALQHNAEDMIVEFFVDIQRAAIHAKRVTVIPKYTKLATHKLHNIGDFLAALGISKLGA